jgi:hypothetical protein
MDELLDLDRFPLDRLDGPAGQALVARCCNALEVRGMVNLDGFVRPQALARCVAEVLPVFDLAAFLHKRHHNIYFDDDVGKPAGHPALNRVETINRTVCADQIPDSLLCRIYTWPPLRPRRVHDNLAAADARVRRGVPVPQRPAFRGRS